ncbi:hypothetical protein [Leptospira sp. GIMC2001]|uniref:hypothetical protein n=1 Tax=Leptospira sp. GIMC2001 TaxID=1513297 RepID=UPI00234B9379|nr:hypothetical protein [Leptospira sp. GIMC2001]WCL48847.1 hypothetical protein O4O04_16295 [Leptospira sp. GIMC2001]
MGQKIKTAIELADMIKEENLNGRDKIPNTETHIKIWCSHFARDEKDIRKILDDLKEAKYIFVVNIVMPDPNLYLPAANSFVYTEIGILNDLKRFADNRLEKIYESTFYKRKSPFQITRELFPKIKEFNNTPMGKAINESVMIDEYIRVLTNSAFEYTPERKLAALKEIYSDESADDIPDVEAQTVQNVRAVDQVKAKENEPENTQWKKITNNFPVDFLVRIHFRKYEFEVVKKLITQGKIRTEDDLKYIRDTLQTMEGRTVQDPILKRHMNEMVELRRLAQAKLNFLRTRSKTG